MVAHSFEAGNFPFLIRYSILASFTSSRLPLLRHWRKKTLDLLKKSNDNVALEFPVADVAIRIL